MTSGANRNPGSAKKFLNSSPAAKGPSISNAPLIIAMIPQRTAHPLQDQLIWFQSFTSLFSTTRKSTLMFSCTYVTALSVLDRLTLFISIIYVTASQKHRGWGPA